MLFRRVHLRGLQRVEAEYIIIAIAHNLRKVDGVTGKEVT